MAAQCLSQEYSGFIYGKGALYNVSGCEDMSELSALFESHLPVNLLGCAEEVRPYSSPFVMTYAQHTSRKTVKAIGSAHGEIEAMPKNEGSSADSTGVNQMGNMPAPLSDDAAAPLAPLKGRVSPGLPDIIHLIEPSLKQVAPVVNTFFQRRNVRDGLENLTKKVVETLQCHGKATFDELHRLTGIETRRLYDITNILAATPLVSKAGRKRERTPFIFGDGSRTTEPVAIEHILLDIELEQTKILILLDAFNKRAEEGGQFMFTC